MNWNIRPVTKEDINAVVQIEAACFPAAEAASAASMRSRIETFPECFFIAETDDKIIGFINGMATDSSTIDDIMFADSSMHKPDGSYQSIFGLDVLPEYRCQGVAASLMEHMIENARAKKRDGLILTCKDRLIHYYSKFGYENMGVSASVHGGAVWYDMILSLHPRH